MTPKQLGNKYTAYTTRSMRSDLLDRCRVVAAVERTTLEDIINRALEEGLAALETRLATHA